MKYDVKRNALYLTLGVIVTRIIGLLFVFPFSKLIGSNGVALFSYGYIPYSLFIDLSTIGIPIGIARIVSKNISNGKENLNYSLLKKSFIIMIFLGVTSFIFFNIFAYPYAKIVLGGNNKLDNDISSVVKVLRITSLSLLIIYLISFYRGFLHGYNKVLIVSISQVLEQVIRIVLILIVCFVLYKMNYSYIYMIYFSMICNLISGLLSLLYLKFKLKLKRNKENISYKKIIKELKDYSLPFLLYGINFSFISLVDSLFFNKGLLKNNITNPELYYGVFSFEIQKIIFFPVAIVLCICSNIVTDLSKSYEEKKYNIVHNKIKKSIKILFLVLIPLSLMFFIFSNQIYNLIFNKEIGGDILRTYSLLIIFYGLSSLTSNIMLGINLQKKLFKNILIGLLIKLFTTYYFIVLFKVSGAIYSTLISLLIQILFNYFYIKKTHLKNKLIK